MKEFKEFKEELDEAFSEFGEIADKKKFDPKNPEVQVKGVGRYKLQALKNNVISKLRDLITKAESGEFEFVNEQLAQKSILNHFVNAILEVEKELQSPVMKRRLTVRRKQQEARDLDKKIVNEVAPPDEKIESWIKSNKERFIKKFGEKEGKRRLFGKGWNLYNKKHR